MNGFIGDRRMSKDDSIKDLLFSKLEYIHKDITDIKVQTTKTNGRVTSLEGKTRDICKEIDEHKIKLHALREHNELQDKEILKIALKLGLIISGVIIIGQILINIFF